MNPLATVEDQLCYELDVNLYKNGFGSVSALQAAMKTGLFLLIDKNSEYDTRRYYDTAEQRSEKILNNIFHHYDNSQFKEKYSA